MARAKKQEKTTVSAKALVNLKYNADVVKAGQEFEVDIKGAEMMAEKGRIELLEEIPEEEKEEGDNPEGNENPNEGE